MHSITDSKIKTTKRGSYNNQIRDHLRDRYAKNKISLNLINYLVHKSNYVAMILIIIFTEEIKKLIIKPVLGDIFIA